MKKLVALFVLLAACAAWASTMKRLSLEQLTAESDRIVICTILSNSYQWQNHRSDMFTVTAVQISRYVKWNGPRIPQIRLRHPGGIGKMDDGNTWNVFVPGVPTFKNGKRAMLFLKQRGDYHELIGWAQGYFRVETNSAGRDIVMRDMDGIEFINDDVSPLPREILLNRFIDTVREMAK